MRHHTKDKGDSGVGFVIADLLSKKIQVAMLISEHLPFDLIAISEKNKLARVSVKYRKLSSKGVVEVVFKSSWADKSGNHVKQHDKSSYDATAIYCPDIGKCYYVRNDEVRNGGVRLRISPSKNGQVKGIRIASDYENPESIF